MIGIILTGHGNFPSGLNSAVKLINGECDKFYAIDFTIDKTPDNLKDEINEKVEEMSNLDGVLILTDIVGGTPFKVSSMLSLEKANIKVVGGMNLPMILELISEREYEKNVAKLYDFALEIGRSEILGFELNIKEEEISEDGI